MITPHAHKHMASAHMVIEGRLRVRTFDRISEQAGNWFTPKSRKAMTLDVIIDGLDPGRKPYEIQSIDPLGGLQLPDGSVRAPLLSFQESMRRYTARS